jgi:hypothetical protein
MKTILWTPELIKRYKTFVWNVFWTVLTMMVAFAADLVPQLNLSQSVALVLSFALAQLSKFLMTK